MSSRCAADFVGTSACMCACVCACVRVGGLEFPMTGAIFTLFFPFFSHFVFESHDCHMTSPVADESLCLVPL